MLWNPAALALLGAKPPVNTGKPALGSAVWGFDTTVPTLFSSDSGGTTQPNSGGTVARVKDMFLGARSMLQATESSKPTWVANALNGKPALRFSGTTAHMMMDGTNPGTLFQTRTFTMLMVYRRIAAGNYGGLFTAGNSELGQNNDGGDVLDLETGPGGWPALYRNGGTDKSSAQLINPSFTANATQKVVCRSAPANGMEIRLRNSNGQYSGTGALPLSADSFTWNVASLGSTMGYQQFRIPFSTLEGDMFEFSFWGERASDADFTALQNYLDLKWGA